MRLSKDARDSSQEDVRVYVSGAELTLLANALNETLTAIDDREFETRLGFAREDARVLRSQIHRILDQSA